MRYTKIALLTYGAGCALGLLVVVFAIGRLARIASGLMAFGLLAIPVGIAMDLWLAANTAARAAKKRAKTPARRTSAAAVKRIRRRRKPTVTKR